MFYRQKKYLLVLLMLYNRQKLNHNNLRLVIHIFKMKKMFYLKKSILHHNKIEDIVQLNMKDLHL